MLRFLHSLNGSFIIKFLLVLIGISFIGWGFGDGIQQRFAGYVAKVNGQKIPYVLFQQELDLKVSQLRRKMGDDYSEEMIANLNLPEKLLRDKVRDILLLQFAGKNNIQVADAEVVSRIAEIDNFKGPLGEFDKNQYLMALQNLGYSIPQFEAGLKTELLVERISNMFTATSFTNATEIERTAQMFAESRNVRILRVVEDDVEAPQKPTDEDLKVIYEDMLSTFITPERRTVEVLLFDTAEIESTIAVTEEDIAAFYKEHRSEFGEPQARVVRHILVADEDTANQVKTDLDGGKSFVDAAKEYSKDPITKDKGGDLGTIYQGDMLEQFDAAAFSMEEGTISDPVKTPFGYHIIKVEEVKETREKTLAEAKADINKRLITERALDQMYDAIDHADAELAGSATLQEVKEMFGGKLTVYENIDPQGQYENETTAKMPNAALILDKAFTIEEAIPSTVISLSPTQKAFVNVSTIVAPRQLTFDEVRDQVVNVYNRESIERAVLAKATKILAQRKKGDTFETLVKKHKLTAPIQTIVGLTRLEPSKNPMISGAVQDQLVSLKKGEVLSRVYPTKMGAALYEVTEVEPGKVNDELKQQVQLTLSNAMANDLYAQFQQALNERASIKINEEQVTAAGKTVIRSN